MRRRILAGIAVIVAVVAISAARRPGEKQPIDFSHKIMAGYNKIDCQFCHPYVSKSVNAGMPPVDKCLTCHDNIDIATDEIQKLKDYKRRNEPIPWVRVYTIADFVRFSHEPHIAADRKCEECHGDVKSMDTVIPAEKVNMGFCIDCHRKNKASVDCLACHY